MNNVTSKRVYEKAWRSHLQTGQTLKAEEKLHWRRKTPQIHFKENCTFYRYIPKQLYAASLICYGYSIKCSAFYNLGLCWSLSERAFGGCTMGTELWGQYRVKSCATLGNCDPSHCRRGVRDGPVGDICCVMEIDVDLDRNHHLMNVVYGLMTARSLMWADMPTSQQWLWMWAGNLVPHTGLWFGRPYKCWKF